MLAKAVVAAERTHGCIRLREAVPSAKRRLRDLGSKHRLMPSTHLIHVCQMSVMSSLDFVLRATTILSRHGIADDSECSQIGEV